VPADQLPTRRICRTPCYHTEKDAADKLDLALARQGLARDAAEGAAHVVARSGGRPPWASRGTRSGACLALSPGKLTSDLDISNLRRLRGMWIVRSAVICGDSTCSATTCRADAPWGRPGYDIAPMRL
jgi:hypothetical protein